LVLAVLILLSELPR